MRSLIAAVLAVLAVAALVSPSQGAKRYPYVAICDGDVCLLAADGGTRVLESPSPPTAANRSRPEWCSLAVSPKTGTVVASLYVDDTSFDPPSDGGSNYYWLYVIDPRTGKARVLGDARYYHFSDVSVWINDKELLLQKTRPDGMNTGVSGLNTRTGALRLVMPPIIQDSEFFYDPSIVSPSGRLLLTTLGITNAGWMSISDIRQGRRLWRTNPERGLEGFAGAAWSADDRWLYAGFQKDDETARSSPGGLWRFDARTGKQYPYRYAKQSIDGVLSVPARKILVVQHDKKIDVLRMTDGRLLKTLSVSKIGDPLAVYATHDNQWLLCGSKEIIRFDTGARSLRTWRPRGLQSSAIRYSATRDALMYIGTEESDDQPGVLYLRSGKATHFTKDAWIEWLPRDVVR